MNAKRRTIVWLSATLFALYASSFDDSITVCEYLPIFFCGQRVNEKNRGQIDTNGKDWANFEGADRFGLVTVAVSDSNDGCGESKHLFGNGMLVNDLVDEVADKLRQTSREDLSSLACGQFSLFFVTRASV